MAGAQREPEIYMKDKLDDSVMKRRLTEILKKYPSMKDAEITWHNSGKENEFIMARTRNLTGANSVQLYTGSGDVYVRHASNNGYLPYSSTIQDGVDPSKNPSNRYGVYVPFKSSDVSLSGEPKGDAQKAHHKELVALAKDVGELARYMAETTMGTIKRQEAKDRALLEGTTKPAGSTESDRAKRKSAAEP